MVEGGFIYDICGYKCMQIMMFQRNLLMFERSLSRNDQFGDWRLNVDTMSYEVFIYEFLTLGLYVKRLEYVC